jgi:hypothetical protein
MGGVDYALVVGGINDAYGVYLASSGSEYPDGIDQYCGWGYYPEDFNFPSTLDSPNSNNHHYSIYCTTTPIN